MGKRIYKEGNTMTKERFKKLHLNINYKETENGLVPSWLKVKKTHLKKLIEDLDEEGWI